MPDPREQAWAVARWCGWERARLDLFLDAQGNGVPSPRELPRSRDAMEFVEREIERRGLMKSYWKALNGVWCEQDAEPFQHFLIRATAAQRLQAAFEVIQKEVESVG